MSLQGGRWHGEFRAAGYQLRTVTRVSRVSVQAGAVWAADQGCLDTAEPWLEPSPASDTPCPRRHQHSSHLCRPPGHVGRVCPGQPWCSPTGTEDGGSQQKQGP